MKSIISALLALFLVVSPASALNFNLKQTKASITWIQGPDMYCTAFSPSIRHLITAGHCVGSSIGDDTVTTKDGAQTRLIYLDKKHDVAILETEETRPLLPLGKEPHEGDTVYQLGYGMSAGKGPFFYLLDGLIVNLHDTPFRDTRSMMLVSSNTLPGMSGGPVVDLKGEVVGMVIGGGRPDEAFWRFGAEAEYDTIKSLYKR